LCDDDAFAVNDLNRASTAVCLTPGCELRFDKPLRERRGYGLFASLLVYWFGFEETIKHDAGVATFRKVKEDNPTAHHDALELPNGKHVLIHNLELGQVLTVLQVPADKIPGPVLAAHWPMTPELEPAHH